MISYVYIVECCDGSFYTGWTFDLEKRVKTHNNGKASKYTRARLPVKLIYQESYKSKKAAMKREYEIKKMSRKEKIVLKNKCH